MDLIYKGKGTYSYYSHDEGRLREVEPGGKFSTSDNHGAELLREQPKDFAKPGSAPAAPKAEPKPEGDAKPKSRPRVRRPGSGSKKA